jgi:hypothetical protein
MSVKASGANHFTVVRLQNDFKLLQFLIQNLRTGLTSSSKPSKIVFIDLLQLKTSPKTGFQTCNPVNLRKQLETQPTIEKGVQFSQKVLIPLSIHLSLLKIQIMSSQTFEIVWDSSLDL